MIASAPGSARLFSATGTIRRSARDFQYELGLDRLFYPVAVMPPQTSSAWMVRTHALRPRTARPDDVPRVPCLNGERRWENRSQR